MSLPSILILIFLFFILAAVVIHSPLFFVLRVISLSFPLFLLIQTFSWIARFLVLAFLSLMDLFVRLIHSLVFLGRPICCLGLLRRLRGFLSGAVSKRTMFARFHFLMKFLMGFFRKVCWTLLTMAIAGRRRLSTPGDNFLMGFIHGMFRSLGFLGFLLCLPDLWRGFLSTVVSGSTMFTFGVRFNFLLNFFAILSVGRLVGRRFNRRMVANFPEHLIEQIFVYLPARSLVRNGCLSKNFRVCFHDRQFLRSRLARNRRPKLIISGVDMLFVELDNSPAVLLPSPVSPNAGDLENMVSDFYGSIDGLILLGVYLIIVEEEPRSSFYIQKGLYNPSIRKFKEIPIPPLDVEEQCGYIGPITSCFGYDLISDDYRVVEVLMFDKPEIWIYSFNSDTWKRVCSLPAHYILNGHGQAGIHLGVFLDGSVYISGNNMIVQFRLCDEQVLTIPLGDENVNSRSLIVIDEALCTMRTNGSVKEFYKLINGTWVPFLVLREQNMSGWTLLGRSADDRYLVNEGDHFLLYGESDGTTENLGVRIINGFDFYILVLETTFWPIRERV